MPHDGPSDSEDDHHGLSNSEDDHDSPSDDIGARPSRTPRGGPDGTGGVQTDDSGSTMRAVVGAVVTFVATFFLPLAPIVGGATTGYLEGGKTDDGIRVGAISGALALIPLALVVPFLLVFFFFDAVLGVFALAVGGAILLFLAAYTVGLSALGGVIGVYLHDEL